MSSKDKLIGASLILIGIGFIALGVFTGIKPVKTVTNNNNQVYTEQQNSGTEVQNNQIQNVVDVYTENNNLDQTEEGSTRYIY